MSIVQRILFSGKVVLFVCVSGLAGAFFGAYPAAAHPSPEGFTATGDHADDAPRVEDIDRMDEDSMREFMEHARIHLRSSEEGRQLTTPSLRSHGLGGSDLYVIGIVFHNNVNMITLHEKYPKAQSATLSDLDSIVGKVREKSEDIVCEQDEGDNYFCAAFLVPEIPGSTIVVVGFDHDFEDLSFSHLTCPYINPGFGVDKDKVAAGEITNEDTHENRERLKKYVVGMERHMLGEGQKVFAAALGRGLNFQEANREANRHLIRLRPCWRQPPWKDGSIYVFIMQEEAGGIYRVVFNGNNPELENLDLNVKDEDGENVGKLISDALAGPDGEGFVEYKWDDPLNPDDDVDAGEPDEDGFRKAPGTSPKVSYIKSVDVQGLTFIFGSGFYPRAESGDDGGCSLAGENSTPSGTAFNLFLAVSVLLAGVWLFKRGKVRRLLLRR